MVFLFRVSGEEIFREHFLSIHKHNEIIVHILAFVCHESLRDRFIALAKASCGIDKQTSIGHACPYSVKKALSFRLLVDK